MFIRFAFVCLCLFVVFFFGFTPKVNREKSSCLLYTNEGKYIFMNSIIYERLSKMTNKSKEGRRETGKNRKKHVRKIDVAEKNGSRIWWGKWWNLTFFDPSLCVTIIYFVCMNSWKQLKIESIQCGAHRGQQCWLNNQMKRKNDAHTKQHCISIEIQMHFRDLKCFALAKESQMQRQFKFNPIYVYISMRVQNILRRELHSQRLALNVEYLT